MAPTPVPQMAGTTVGDGLDREAQLLGAIGECNIDKAALRGWVDGVKARDAAERDDE